SRISVLHHGLSPALRQSFEETSDSLFSIPYNEYIELVQSLNRRSRRPQPVQPLKPASRQSSHMDIDPIRVSSIRMSARRLSESSSRSSSRS
ncbi:hypothetical protein EJ02DRAFT_482368, partial [Clathrospora elynae]